MAGTVQVVRFNWPKYVASAVVAGAAAASGTVLGVPAVVVVPLAAAAALGIVWTVTSLVATWWVYDHRRVYDRVALGLAPVGRWASVHAGFDDATPRLASSVGHPPATVVELALPAGDRASLRRARPARRAHGVHHGAPMAVAGAGEPQPAPPPRSPARRPRATPHRRPAATTGPRSWWPLDGGAGTGGPPGCLPLPTGTLDTVFLTFAVHEVRDLAAQRALFGELRRVLRPGGRLVVTEHLRDLANLAVYGPGAFHFQPGRTWHRRAAEVGFDLRDDATISPFVHRLTWQR